MKEIILISRSAEPDKNLLTMLQVLFPKCRTRIVHPKEDKGREPAGRGEEDVKYFQGI